MNPTPEPSENPPSSFDLLERALPYIEEAATISGYGFHRPANPHHFFPDAESSSAEELAAHKAACEAWDRGEYKRDPSQESGWVGNIHILKAPWGIGAYQYVSEEGEKLITEIKAALTARQKGEK